MLSDMFDTEYTKTKKGQLLNSQILQQATVEIFVKICLLKSRNYYTDKEKPHLHLLSTHIYIHDYNTSFVNTPRQLVAIVCFEFQTTSYDIARTITLVSGQKVKNWWPQHRQLS